MKTIKALISFVHIGANGSITSYAGGQVYEVTNEIATQMIAIGYAEEYSGGGESWQTVFEGSVTTEEDDGAYVGRITSTRLSADSIKVTFNGTEYTCNKVTLGAGAVAYGGVGAGGFDFTDYPFAIVYQSGEYYSELYTESAGTYTLKIEEQQSGGSSDFSTAEVTIINNTSAEGYIRGAVTIEAEGEQPACTLYDIYYEANKTITDNLVLYKGGAVIEIQSINPLISGNIESLGDHMYLVTGDCTITIS